LPVAANGHGQGHRLAGGHHRLAQGGLQRVPSHRSREVGRRAGREAGHLQAHLDQVADHGDPNNPDAHTFNPETPEDLVNDIIGIVGGAVGCEIVLEGRVEVGKECSGTVEMNGNRLPCCIDDGSGFACDQTPMTDPDGWRLKDPSVVELVGQTCISFLEATGDTMLRAAFPCDIYVE
jgi:hypothetical protein